MAITSGVTAQQMGLALAEETRDEPRISELWVATRPDGVHVWLVVQPMATDEQRRLYLLADVLHERFPGSLGMLHILNPHHHQGDVHSSIPREAVKIERDLR